MQAAFGRHDLGGVSAHVGGAAATASAALGARAYAHGDAVAFASAPDLHTAAHEAAHVIQQRGGVQLKGDVGQAGDAYEAHADQVADLVVAGRSAEATLDRMAGGGAGGRATQFLHGDLSVPVRPELGDRGASVADGLAALDASRGITRDANMNNARKVEFESKLFAALLRNAALLAPAVHAVSRAVLDYIDRREALAKDSAATTLAMLGGKSNFYGRLVDAAHDDPLFATTLRGVLASGGGSLQNHVLVHHQFWEHIYEKIDWGSGVAQTLVAAAKDPKHLRGQTEITVGDTTVKPFDKSERGRVASTAAEQGGRAHEVFEGGTVPLVPAETGIHGHADGGPAAIDTGNVAQSHTRGIDMWTIDERKAFTQQARLMLDMPIAAGVSGTTADLVQCAMTMGLTGAALHRYCLAVLGFLGSAGAHSFHEIMTVCRAAGVAYTPGDYRGVYPAELEQTADFAALRAAYPDFFGGAAPSSDGG
ncbi:MAG: DUF4157 domain-containing protein [Kofleriaceae bacterium]